MKPISNLDTSTPFKIGDWTINPSASLVMKQGEQVKLEPKVMEVLVYLAQNQGEVISRESLEANIWTGMVIGYDAVSGSIVKLRKALGDDPRNPRYIKTVSKKGYQLIALVNMDTNSKETVTTVNSTSQSQTTPDPGASLAATLPNQGLKLKILIYMIAITPIVGLIIYLFSPNSSTPQKNAVPSIVVLPFKNLSGDTQQTYLSDGITDDLITELSRVHSLRVIARQSSYHYKNYPTQIEDIARQLGVSFIVEGSVRKLNDTIRINVQLTDTKKGESVWAKRIDTDTKNIFKAQDDIIQNVLSAMVTFSGGHIKAIESKKTNNFDAYDAFLLGQQHIKTRNKQGFEQAMKAFERSLELDPNYARAYGAMAVALTRAYRYQWTNLSLVEARERALVLAKKAAQLDPSSPQIYWALAYVHLHRREYDEAESAAKKSIDLSPNYADALALIANIAIWRGKPKETIDSITHAKSINPHYSFQYASNLGLAYYFLGNFAMAVKHLRDALDRNENALNPRLYLAASYAGLKQTSDAEWEIEQIRANRPDIRLSTLDTLLPFEDKKHLVQLKSDLLKAGLAK